MNLFFELFCLDFGCFGCLVGFGVIGSWIGFLVGGIILFGFGIRSFWFFFSLVLLFVLMMYESGFDVLVIIIVFFLRLGMYNV